MVSVNTAKTALARRTTHLIAEESVVAIVLGVLLILCAIFSIQQQYPSRAVAVSDAANSFSADDAMQHLAVIAEKPRPMGSIEHDAVRDYLFRQLAEAGLEPQVQQATIITNHGPPTEMAAVENVLSRLKGTTGGKSVLLVAHYDSVPGSFGASDDGSAVATLIETLRALKTGPALKNDVVLLFTDGEENGLLGARAFVNEHPWARNVGVVMNFEARGNSGPVIMFEVTENNGWLIQEFAKAAPFPVAHSMSYEIYKLLPNDTDLTVFKKAGMAGLNFAYIDGLSHYHTSQDSISAVNVASLQHQGSYSLALARHLGNLDLGQTKANDAIYFDVLGKWMVRYSARWAIPLALLACALFCVLVVVGLRKKKLSVRGMLIGFLGLLASLVVASLSTTLLWKALWLIRSGSTPSPNASQSRLLMLSFVVLACATILAVYAFARRYADVESLATGSLLWWLILTAITAFFLPGASFLFQWPLCFGLIGVSWMLVASEKYKTHSILNALVLAAVAVPSLLLLAPVIHQTFVGLTLQWTPLIIGLVVLLLGLLVPQLLLIARAWRWWLPGGTAVAGLVLLLAGVIDARGVAASPNSIYYALNADSGKAVWAGDTAQQDPWMSQFLSGGTQGTLADFAYANRSRQYLVSGAPVAALPPPELNLLEDNTVDGVRNVRMRISSPRRAAMVSVYLDSPTKVLRAVVNNKVISGDGEPNWGLRISGFPQEGMEMQLRVQASEPLKLRVVDQSYGLPQLSGASYTPRPQSLNPATTAKTDFTLLRKTVSY